MKLKIFSMNEIEDLTNLDIEDILTVRSNEFVSSISKAAKGHIIEAFGEDSNGIWGQYPKVKKFKIKDITSYGDGAPIQTERNKKPYYMVSLDVHLQGYDDSKNYGMMYTDDRAEESFKKLFKEILGDDVNVSWSEQGMQGDYYVNLDFSYPAKFIAPDFLQYFKIQEKIQKIQNDADKILSETKTIQSIWPSKKKTI